MTVRAITPADIPLIVSVWEAQRAIVGLLAPALPYAAWTPESASGFLAMAAVSRMDDVSGSFCALSLNPEAGQYETVPGITLVVPFGQCFRACAAALPPGASVYGSSPATAPADVRAWLDARFVATEANGVRTWRATAAEVMAAA